MFHEDILESDYRKYLKTFFLWVDAENHKQKFIILVREPSIMHCFDRELNVSLRPYVIDTIGRLQ